VTAPLLGSTRRIFDLALGRAGMPLGVKAIVNELNGAGCQHRGKPFHISAVHRILTAATYTGVHHFNRHEAKTGRSKEPDQWIAVTMPQIIPAEDFELVQSSLKARSPKRMPPRVVGNPTLLTGIARCATCGSGMTLRTGKSGRYRYYTCAGCAQKGKTACLGRSISMAALDGMILEHLADKLFTPERLRVMLDAYIARSAEADSQRRERLAHARRRHGGAGQDQPVAGHGRAGPDECQRPHPQGAAGHRQAGPAGADRAGRAAGGGGRKRRSGDHRGAAGTAIDRDPGRAGERRPGLPQSLHAVLRRAGRG